MKTILIRTLPVTSLYPLWGWGYAYLPSSGNEVWWAVPALVTLISLWGCTFVAAILYEENSV